MKTKKYLIVEDCLLDKVLLDKIKMIIGIEKFDDIKILIEADDKLPYVPLKKLLGARVVKDNDKFYLQIFLEEALVA